jgi:hypothetical protein
LQQPLVFEALLGAMAGGNSDSEEDEENEGANSTDAAEQTPMEAEEPEPEVRPTYAQRVCRWFAAICVYYMFLHEDHGDTCDLDRKKREELAKKAAELGVDLVRAGLACRGTDRKCGYDHDILYGVPKLFLVLGKPQLGACEGAEHAHQEFKAFFKRMCSHNSKKYCDMLQFMNLHALKRHVCNEHKDLLPPTKYSELLSGMHLVTEVRKKPKMAPRVGLTPITNTEKVLMWGAEHGLSEPNLALAELKGGETAVPAGSAVRES